MTCKDKKEPIMRKNWKQGVLGRGSRWVRDHRGPVRLKDSAIRGR